MAKRLALFLGFLLTWSYTCAQLNATRIYKADGKIVNYKLTIFNPPIPMTSDPGRLNQDSAADCSLLFISELHDEDIAGAAAVSTNLEAAINTHTDYKAEVGEVESKKQTAGVFSDDQYRYELVEGHEDFLIKEKSLGEAAPLIEKDGKYWMDGPKFGSESQGYKDLFKLVNDHAAGKLEFK